MDFQFDATADGRRLNFLNVMDKHSRFCLAIRVGRRRKAKDLLAVWRSSPVSIRPRRSSDRGTGRNSQLRRYGTVRSQRKLKYDIHRARISVGKRLRRIV